MAAVLRDSVEQSAPTVAAELSALLRRPIEVTSNRASGRRPGASGISSRVQSGPVAAITIDFHGEVTGRGTLSMDHASLEQLAHWLPPEPFGQPTRPRGQAAGARETRSGEEISDPLVRGALLEIGSVLLGGVLAAFRQRSATCIALGLPRWYGPTGPPPAAVPASDETVAVSLRLSTSSSHTPAAANVSVQFVGTDPRIVDGSAERKVMA